MGWYKQKLLLPLRWVIFLENIQSRVSQNRNGIILLHGTIDRSNFNRLKSPDLDFHYFWDYWKCQGPLFLMLAPLFSAELLKIGDLEIKRFLLFLVEGDSLTLG